ncbi:peptidylprolyl isomerase [Marinobacter sp. CHS3-4]|uniref:peptidylprolyl isomerase n=1 Tax=Marinobacter sp. CHS3-4 TaxID=3045174 RepID=UPI0024B4C60C|nr:peptidylprolyl isomerase [Marinobacter sp. CHS3-4]MDI9245342.1 peptidylprolyl isomerase [Marinobacter sp. CHS3-4]
MLGKLLKDPLVHFTLAGMALFAGYYAVGGQEDQLDETTIVVDRSALLTFIQYRSKAFDAEQANEKLASMNEQKRKELIRDYVREEALFREAKLLGMMENDYIVRRRSVQKLEFIAQGVAERLGEVNDQELTAYFEKFRDDYYVSPSYSFTHVFIKDGVDNPELRAKALLEKLNAERVGNADATPFGDRFLYHRNYVERTPDFIASHFGNRFKDGLSQLEASVERWQGPIVSKYGLHLIKLNAYRPGRAPELAEVRHQVESDFLRWQKIQQQEVAIQGIVERYDVETRL